MLEKALGSAAEKLVKERQQAVLVPRENIEEVGSRKVKVGVQPSHCTDIGCLLVFFLALSFLAVIVNHSRENGDFRRLYHGFDFLGNLCGVDKFEDKPYLFYCTDPNQATGLDLAHPICIESCPISTETWHSCYEGHTTKIEITDPSTQSFDETFHYTFKQVGDYPSYVFAGRYCMPQNRELFSQLKIALLDTWGSRILFAGESLVNSWMAILFSILIAVLCGYAYLACLKALAGVFVYVCLVIPSVCFVIAGVHLILVSRDVINLDHISSVSIQDQELNLSIVRSATTGNDDWDLFLGIALVVAGLAFAFVFACCRKSIAIAVGCVEATCECMKEVPSLLLNPLLTVAGTIFWTLLMLGGFAWLVSCGKVTSKSLAHYVTTPGLGDVKGIARSFEYKEEEYYYLAFYVFMIIWVFEICIATAQFTLIYAVELWYFTPYVGNRKRGVPLAPLVRGLRVAVQFHMGSLAFGAFLIATLRVLRMIGALVAKREKDRQNDVGSCIAKCCTCIVTCFQRFIEYVNKNAYMDIAMHSSSYCTGAFEAFKLLNENLVSVALLNGVTWVLQVAGIGTVSAGGAGLTYLMVQSVPWFNDPEQETFIPDATPVCVTAAIVSAAAAWVFMMVFDTASDTILYCFVLDHKAHEGWMFAPKYAPPSLKRLIEKHTPQE